MWLSWTRKSNTDLIHPLLSRKINEMILTALVCLVESHDGNEEQVKATAVSKVPNSLDGVSIFQEIVVFLPF